MIIGGVFNTDPIDLVNIQVNQYVRIFSTWK